MWYENIMAQDETIKLELITHLRLAGFGIGTAMLMFFLVPDAISFYTNIDRAMVARIGVIVLLCSISWLSLSLRKYRQKKNGRPCKT